MTKIKMLNDRIIFDGHADSRQECETITLMCNNLAKSKDFKTIRYESGYAEFEKVGKTEELKFRGSASITINFDEHITKVTCDIIDIQTEEYPEWTTSGANNMLEFGGAPDGVFTVTLADGYVIASVTGTKTSWEETSSVSFSDITDNSFIFTVEDSTNYTITITSKIPGTGLKQVIDVSKLPGWVALATGNHQITIKTKASGYVNSAASNAVTVSKAASGGHNLTIQYNREDAPSGVYMYSYGKVSYRVNGETAYTEINSAGTTQIENCNTVELYSAIGTAEWEGSGVYVTEGTSTIKFNGQDYTDNTLVTLTQDSTFIITETPTYAEMDNPCDPKCCFVAGTKVKTPNGEQAIETLKAGDYITTYNEETKQYEPNKVLRKLINRNVTELATLKLRNGETLQFNAYHPLLTENGYKSLTCHNDLPLLTKEDKLIGGITIEEIVVENLENPIAAYNLLVENNNNFIVNGVIALGKDD